MPADRPRARGHDQPATPHAIASCGTPRTTWGHSKIWAMVRHEGHVVSEAMVLRLLRDEGLILPAH